VYQKGFHGVGVWPLDCWDREFEFRRGHGCSSLVFVVCCVRCVLCEGLITCSEEPHLMCMSVCDLETSTVRRLRPDASCCTTGIKTDRTLLSFTNTRACRPPWSDCDWRPSNVTCLDKRFSLFWCVTQRRLLLSFWRFGTSCRYHLQGSSIPRGIVGSRTEACNLRLQETAHLLASKAYIFTVRIVTSVPGSTYKESS
jgi:hypothetical protein